jgi:prolyl oligopeptidase
VAGVEIPPPLPAQPVTDTYWGVEVVDPYRFLENAKDPAIQTWLRAQATATETILGKIPGRATLLARITEIEAAAAGVTDRVTRTEGDRYFFLRRNPGEDQFKLVWRDGINGKDTVLVDPEALAKAAGRPHAIMDFAPSRDGRKLAYSIQVGGGEIGLLHVIDVASGQPLIAPIDRIRYGSISWLDDANGFFYSRLRENYDKLPPTERFQDNQRRYRALDATGTDRLIFSYSHNPELKLPGHAGAFIFQIPGTKLAAAVVYLGVERNQMLFLADLDAAIRGDAQWRKLVDVEDRVSDIALADGWIYLRSAKGAPRYQVLRMPLAAPDINKAQIAVPEARSVIGNLAGARDGLYFTRREGATLTLSRIPVSPDSRAINVEPIALPFAGNVGIESATPQLNGVVLELGSWTRAARPYLYEPGKGGLKMLPFVNPGAYDAPPGLAVREVHFKSHDGTEVPLTVIARTDLRLDGRNPTILYGYGAYGITEDPAFNPRVLAWLERGGVYAIAHVRGGGAYGEGWHSAGHKTTKHNTWKDAIAAGEWLIANKYTSPSRLGIFGGSAGGILVGRAITERPDLFAAAVPSVPVLDTVRSETRANGVANVPEYGTVKKEDEFKALLAMSSYHHLKDGTRYPAVMLSHGVNDTRVDIWQSAKFASRLGALTGSPRPVLMRLDFESGHGQGSTRGQAQERTTDIYTFFLWQFGDPQFQPR